MRHTLLFLVFYLNIVFGQAANAQFVINYAGHGPVVNSPANYGDGGPAKDAVFTWPVGICRDDSLNLYIADEGEGLVRKINAATGIITTIAGGGAENMSMDNIPATTAYIGNPYGICFDHNGNLLIADGISRIRMVNLGSGIITTIAGTPIHGYSGDGGPAINAQFYLPRDVATDPAGNIYVADFYNNAVRKIESATGIISTLKTSIPPWDDTTNISIYGPTGVYVNSSSDVFISDFFGGQVIKYVAATGVFVGIAGFGNGPDGGSAFNAFLKSPFRVTQDGIGNMYIAETGAYRIRKISTDGSISTYAGIGTINWGSTGDGGPALSASLYPFGLLADSCGDLLFLNSNNTNSVRAVVPQLPEAGVVCGYRLSPPDTGSLAPGNGMQVLQGAGNGTFSIILTSGQTEPAEIVVHNVPGQLILKAAATTNVVTTFQLNVASGVYFITGITAQGRWTKKIVIGVWKY